MTLRITPHRQLQQQVAHTQSQASRSAKLQNQISSGIRVHRPSDDPQAQQKILNQQSAIKRLDAQLKSIAHGVTTLNQTNVQLLDAQSLVVQAKSLALQAHQAVTPFELNALATEIDGYLATLDSVANSKVDGRYLFGGIAHDAPPYSGIVKGPTVYQGSHQESSVLLFDEARIPVFLAGNEVFSFVDPDTGASTDVFATLRTLRDTLRSAESLTPPEFGEQLDAVIAQLEQGNGHLLTVIGEHAVSLEQLDRIQSRTEDLQFQAQQILSETQATDAASAIIDLQEQQNLLQLTFASTVRIFDLSVLDFLA